mmetsp:Transcript_51745/g.130852  ORF Transcript_51745/g.130852 Transcript_51745/m.130852 type:complete len:222 (-) Transcript_51745:308-973(-)
MKSPKRFVAENLRGGQPSSVETVVVQHLAQATSEAEPKANSKLSNATPGLAHADSKAAIAASPAALDAKRKWRREGCPRPTPVPLPAKALSSSEGVCCGSSAAAKAAAPSSESLPRTRETSCTPPISRPDIATARAVSSPRTALSSPKLRNGSAGASDGTAGADEEEAAAGRREATARTRSAASSSRKSVPPTTSSRNCLAATPLAARPSAATPRPESRLP